MKKILFIVLMTIELVAVKNFTLGESINEALLNNKKNNISKLALEIAKYQHKQAQSANYPNLNLELIANRSKVDESFKMFDTIQFDASALGGGILDIPLDLDVKVAGRDSRLAKLEMLYPLYTGGKITSIIEQANLNKLLAKENISREKINIIFDVKQYFYAYRLSSELFSLANDVYLRMKNLEKLTKQFLEEGDSLNIKKTDYLNMQVTVALIGSKVTSFKIKKELSKAALKNVMGIKYDKDVNFIYNKNDISYNNESLENIIKEAYLNNKDLSKINIVLDIYEEKIKEAKAEYYPDIALVANARRGYNSYTYSKLNDNTWSVALVAKLPLFNGFATKNKIKEKELRKIKMQENKHLLKEGLALLLNNEFIKSSYTYKQILLLKNAKTIASANRELNVRAYRIDAVTSKEVIEAQLSKAYVEIDYLVHVHDYLLSLAKIEQLIGIEIKK